MKKRILTLIIILLSNASVCALGKDTVVLKDSEIQRIEMLLKSKYPNIKVNMNNISIHDNHSLWEIRFELPEDTIGGSPILWVDKKTLVIVKSVMTQ